MQHAPADLGPIKPRAMEFDLDDLPRHWMAGLPVSTAIGNALHLIFPMGERFFVRAVRHYMGAIDDPTLREQIRGFFGQEGRHAHEHERVFEILRGQGYDIDTFLRVYKRVAFDFIERISPPALRLSVTAALEHYTAIMAEGALTDQGTLAVVHPKMQRLLRWHAAEEIEHKAVAFDVLKQVRPSYALRMAGMALATTLLGAFWLAGAVMLMRQEKDLSLREALRQLRATQQREPIIRRVFLRGLREYLRPSFHPWDNDNLELARRNFRLLEDEAA
ncbi:metal-dependent hydrolase [Nannocystis bainbridge]|uniref:Metal-dependent hydrolase n=1 Tax=Nannocystis bainbridge TaxID=2995303 RepID=A0ABT5DUJ5_9BACT|nr:metal-dependent hydrolase [Nannocystis bainbridge]MDC0717296.1 metal-dependent hydrolase [Nannocystis bainbridge]